MKDAVFKIKENNLVSNHVKKVQPYRPLFKFLVYTLTFLARNSNTGVKRYELFDFFNIIKLINFFLT